jgi:hypothetical protein
MWLFTLKKFSSSELQGKRVKGDVMKLIYLFLLLSVSCEKPLDNIEPRVGEEGISKTVPRHIE